MRPTSQINRTNRKDHRLPNNKEAKHFVNNHIRLLNIRRMHWRGTTQCTISCLRIIVTRGESSLMWMRGRTLKYTEQGSQSPIIDWEFGSLNGIHSGSGDRMSENDDFCRLTPCRNRQITASRISSGKRGFEPSNFGANVRYNKCNNKWHFVDFRFQSDKT